MPGRFVPQLAITGHFYPDASFHVLLCIGNTESYLFTDRNRFIRSVRIAAQHRVPVRFTFTLVHSFARISEGHLFVKNTSSSLLPGVKIQASKPAAATLPTTPMVSSNTSTNSNFYFIGVSPFLWRPALMLSQRCNSVDAPGRAVSRLIRGNSRVRGNHRRHACGDG